MNRFENILYLTDSIDDELSVFSRAIELAKNNQATLTVVGIVDTLSLRSLDEQALSDLNRGLVAQKHQQLQSLVDAVDSNHLEINLKVLSGNVALEIIREVLEHKRDLVIKAVDAGVKLGGTLFASVEMKLLRYCSCPVWLIKTASKKSHQRIVVGLDYEPDNIENDQLNERLLEISVFHALANFSELYVVHAWKLEGESFLRSPWSGQSEESIAGLLEEEEALRTQWLNETVNRYCQELGEEGAAYLKPNLHLVKGKAEDVIPMYTKEVDADLVVLGTLGRTGIPGFTIGNTAETILRRIDCSVLAIKPDSFETPVTLK